MGGLSEVGTQCREGIRHDSTEGKFAGEKQKRELEEAQRQLGKIDGEKNCKNGVGVERYRRGGSKEGFCFCSDKRWKQRRLKSPRSRKRRQSSILAHQFN